MQIVSLEDNLHEMSKPVLGKNKKKMFQNKIFFLAIRTIIRIIKRKKVSKFVC